MGKMVFTIILINVKSVYDRPARFLAGSPAGSLETGADCLVGRSPARGKDDPRAIPAGIRVFVRELRFSACSTIGGRPGVLLRATEAAHCDLRRDSSTARPNASVENRRRRVSPAKDRCTGRFTSRPHDLR